MQIISTDFVNGGNIPRKYTCDGDDINPSLEFGGVPKEAKSLALVLDDPDAPSGTFTHWVMWNIPPKTDKILPGTIPVGAVEGLNSTRNCCYIGPCPPTGTHNYIFTLFALDTTLNDLNPKLSDKNSLFDSMTGHILASAELVGLYKRG